MAAAIRVRDDFDAIALRAIAKRAKDAPQARRLLALAAIYDGGARGEAAKIGGVGLQVVRDWVLRFNAHGPDGLIDRKAPGQPSLLKDEQTLQGLSWILPRLLGAAFPSDSFHVRRDASYQCPF